MFRDAVRSEGADVAIRGEKASARVSWVDTVGGDDPSTIFRRAFSILQLRQRLMCSFCFTFINPFVPILYTTAKKKSVWVVTNARQARYLVVVLPLAPCFGCACIPRLRTVAFCSNGTRAPSIYNCNRLTRSTHVQPKAKKSRKTLSEYASAS